MRSGKTQLHQLLFSEIQFFQKREATVIKAVRYTQFTVFKRPFIYTHQIDTLTRRTCRWLHHVFKIMDKFNSLVEPDLFHDGLSVKIIFSISIDFIAIS